DGSCFELDFHSLPVELQEFWLDAVEGRGCYFAAWNMAFDRLALSNIPNAPKLEPHHTIDVMAQAVASNMPGKLDGAARSLGLGNKQDDGKALIHLFCSADGPQPADEPAKWQRFISYGLQDTHLLREIYKATRP